MILTVVLSFFFLSHFWVKFAHHLLAYRPNIKIAIAVRICIPFAKRKSIAFLCISVSSIFDFFVSIGSPNFITFFSKMQLRYLNIKKVILLQ